MARIEYRDGIYFLYVGREVPMGFWTRESAVSFATNNLGLLLMERSRHGA